MSLLNVVFVAATLLGSSYANFGGELDLGPPGDVADDVCKVLTLVESISCFDTFFPQNTVLTIPDSCTINIENAPTNIHTCVTVTTTLNPPSLPPVIQA